MRVERLSVSGFGKLAAREVRFGPGLTIVHGPNESGKSTTHAALRAALFGLTAGGRRTREETAAIERYRPWADARYGAVLELTADAGGGCAWNGTSTAAGTRCATPPPAPTSPPATARAPTPRPGADALRRQP